MLKIPDRIAALPFDEQRGLHVPWFVHWLEDGRPEFRIVGAGKFNTAIKFKQCWVCGQQLGRHLSFVLGPMCTITRTTSEPPCHHECAVYSALACPFLIKPHMRRRDENLGEAPGLAILRNPGVTAVWNTRSFKLFPDGKGSALITVGDPESVFWFREGRAATREECEESIRTGLPKLDEQCDLDKDPVVSRIELGKLVEKAKAYLP